MFLNLYMYLLIFRVITANCDPPNKLQLTQKGYMHQALLIIIGTAGILNILPVLKSQHLAQGF